ncbi:MAG: DUF86 domain-containing protein [Methanomassiliicoccaceae archaeon]|nr:DUF86 domain-containing protein [Methanomassiliicoccaceae archaeon]
MSSFYIIQIGEAVGDLINDHPGITSRHPEIRWRGIVNMRNVMAHGYEGFDVDAWWNTITVHVPILKDVCIKILSEL